MPKIKYDISYFQNIAENKKGKCLSEKYEGYTNKLNFECKNGHKFSMIPSSIIKGQWCSRCHFDNIRKYTIDDFKNMAKQHGGECLSEQYIARDKKLTFKCSCGRVWDMLPQSLIIGCWCEVCSKKSKLTIDNFKEIAKNNNGKCLSDSFINKNTTLKFECEKGHQWETRAKNIKHGCWCPKCKLEKQTIYSLDHDFFSKDTEESFYWAGFFFADGCIRQLKKQFLIQLKLATKDKDHLLKFKNAIKSTHPLHYEKPNQHYINNNLAQSTGSFALIFSSEKSFNALSRFGIIPRKTYEADIPEFVKTHKFANHFWRGWADGDGSFAIGYDSVVFTGVGNKKALKSFHDILFLTGINKNKEKTTGKSKGSDLIGTISYGGNINMCRLYDFLYSDATIFLERKEQIARKAKELISRKNFDRLYSST